MSDSHNIFFSNEKNGTVNSNKYCVLSFRIRIRPRVLIDVTKRDTSCNIFGVSMRFPVAIAPTAMQKLAAPCGERATARGKIPSDSNKTVWPHSIKRFD